MKRPIPKEGTRRCLCLIEIERDLTRILVSPATSQLSAITKWYLNCIGVEVIWILPKKKTSFQSFRAKRSWKCPRNAKEQISKIHDMFFLILIDFLVMIIPFMYGASWKVWTTFFMFAVRNHLYRSPIFVFHYLLGSASVNYILRFNPKG